MADEGTETSMPHPHNHTPKGDTLSAFEESGDLASIEELKDAAQEAINRLTDWPQRMGRVGQGLEKFLWEQVRGEVSRADLFLDVRLYLELHEEWAKRALGDLESDLTIPPLSEMPEEEQNQKMIDRIVDLVLQASPMDQLEDWDRYLKEGQTIGIW